ncbi:phospholipase A2 inhibitor and Ly6/PLAUR domain-containing protein-like isoform X2 [Malaclemys terrapin pileata]|nr:phospholipase A2 inhibitor and Ly6/PLAUR domain-containing protein-like isoform X2 [Malaclemys terrapin pileata]
MGPKQTAGDDGESCVDAPLFSLFSGMPLTCFYCKSGESCFHNLPQICSSPQDACIIVQEHNMLAFQSSMWNGGTYQSCADSRQSLTGFLAFYFGATVTVEIRSEICKTNDCNAHLMPIRQAISNIRNGLQCPACYSPGFESCESNESLRCTGGADQCAVIVGMLAQGAASFTLGRVKSPGSWGVSWGSSVLAELGSQETPLRLVTAETIKAITQNKELHDHAMPWLPAPLL